MSLHVAVSGWLLGPPSGANRRLLALLRAAAAQLEAGERITVLHRPDFAPPWQQPSLCWQSVDVPSAPSWRRALAERRLLPAVLRRLGADLLDHGMLPAPRVGRPVVLTIHDLRDADGEGRRWRWFAAAVLRRSLRRVSAVVVPSRFTRDRLLAHAPHLRAPVHIVANAVDLPAMAASVPPPPRFVLHVGHLERRKQLDVLLHAVAALPRRVELRLAGADAGDGARLRRLARRLGIADATHFLGDVDDRQLAQLYADAAVVAVPSRYEGFGLPALEGLAAGRPVLVSDRGALPEIVGAHATVVPGTAAAFAEALAAALAAPPTDAASALRIAHARLRDWPAMAAVMLRIWRAVAGT